MLLADASRIQILLRSAMRLALRLAYARTYGRTDLRRLLLNLGMNVALGNAHDGEAKICPSVKRTAVLAGASRGPIGGRNV